MIGSMARVIKRGLAVLIAALLLACNNGGDPGSEGEGDDANLAPSAHMDTPLVAGLTVTLNAAGSWDPDGDPLTYEWHYGDGQTDTGVYRAHTYDDAGDYTVTLTVSDGQFENTTARVVTVTEPAVSFPRPFDTDARYLEDIYVAPAPAGQ